MKKQCDCSINLSWEEINYFSQYLNGFICYELKNELKDKERELLSYKSSFKTQFTRAYIEKVKEDIWEQLKTIADPKLSDKEEIAWKIDCMEVGINKIQDECYRLEVIAYKLEKYILKESGYIYKSSKLKHKKKTASMCLKELNNYKNYPYSN